MNLKILNISQILPIPDIAHDNNFVFKLMEHYKLQFPSDSLFFFRSVPYTNKLLGKYIQKRKTPLPKGFEEYIYNHQKIKILKFISAWSKNNLHSILTHTIYWINKRQIETLLNKEHISIVHAQFIYPDGLLALIIKKKFNIPYIITTHQELKYFNNFISRKIAISILKNAYKIVPLNFKNYNFFISLGLNNIEVIPLGLDEIFFSKSLNNKVVDEFRIISIGELIKLKNIDKVLLALKLLKKKYRIRYSIVGTGDQLEFLKRMVQQLSLNDIVEFNGYIEYSQMPNILKQHDLFILPSFPETFGRVYFEAMAARLPVICAKNSGIFGYFPDYVDVYAVNPENPKDISEKIAYFIDNKEKRIEIGKTLQSKVRNFTWDEIAKKHGKLYREACESVVIKTYD